MTDTFAPLLKRLELTFADRRKRYMDLMIGADSETKSRRIKAIRARTGGRKAIMVINVGGFRAGSQKVVCGLLYAASSGRSKSLHCYLADNNEHDDALWRVWLDANGEKGVDDPETRMHATQIPRVEYVFFFFYKKKRNPSLSFTVVDDV